MTSSARPCRCNAGYCFWHDSADALPPILVMEKFHVEGMILWGGGFGLLVHAETHLQVLHPMHIMPLVDVHIPHFLLHSVQLSHGIG